MNGVSTSENETKTKKYKNKGTNKLLADIIWLFHLFIVVFILLAPFTNIPALLILHVSFSLSLLVHWYGNNNVCSLSFMESSLRGLDHTESFTHKFIAPLYDISKTEWSKYCYVITIILMSVSIYYLYQSPRVAKAFECYNNMKINTDILKLPFYKRINVYFNCFADLFIIN